MKITNEDNLLDKIVEAYMVGRQMEIVKSKEIVEVFRGDEDELQW